MADELTNITFRVDGDKHLLLVFDAIERWPRHGGKDFIDFLATHAEFWTRIYAPIGETGKLEKAIGKTNVRWRPGGAGGGGVLQASTGVTRVNKEQYPEQSIYPVYVHEGTGRRSGGWIYAKGFNSPTSNPHPVMVLQKGGEVGTKKGGKLRYRVKGQEANPYLKKAFHQTSIYARVRLHTLGREIVRIP